MYLLFIFEFVSFDILVIRLLLVLLVILFWLLKIFLILILFLSLLFVYDSDKLKSFLDILKSILLFVLVFVFVLFFFDVFNSFCTIYTKKFVRIFFELNFYENIILF